LARWVRRSTKERANGKQSSPRREDYSPGRRKGLHRLAQIRTFAISQREEFSLFTSKFESDMPSHGVGLYRGIFRRAVQLQPDQLSPDRAATCPERICRDRYARTPRGGVTRPASPPARDRPQSGSSRPPSRQNLGTIVPAGPIEPVLAVADEGGPQACSRSLRWDFPVCGTASPRLKAAPVDKPIGPVIDLPRIVGIIAEVEFSHSLDPYRLLVPSASCEVTERQPFALGKPIRSPRRR
jgi:hypothetical protein